MESIKTISQRLLNDGRSQEIIDLYSQFGGRRKVAELLGINYGSVGHLMDALGFRITRSSRRSLEKFEGKIRNPFDGSDFGEYLKGYLLGDGSIRVKNGRIRGINISSSDKDHLIKIRDLWDASLQIKGPYKGSYSIDCYDSSIANYLCSIGFVPAKSKVGMILEFPITWAFLRGLFDSDGSVSYGNSKTTLRIMFAGNHSYMKQVDEFLKEFNIKHDDRGSFTITRIFLQRDIKRIRDLMYNNASIYMTRKHERMYSI